MDNPAIIVEQLESTLVITINRPEARNAVNAAVANGISDGLDRLENDPALRIGIITGAGGTFCAGQDLKAFLRGEMGTSAKRGFGGITKMPPSKPVIAAVDGYALAGGMEIAIACDLIVANVDAQFGLPEVRRGLAAGAGGLLRLSRELPYKVAMQYALTGEAFSARRAFELGLVNMLVETPALEAALLLAAQISANGPLAVAASRKVVAESRLWSETEMWDLQESIVRPVITSLDAREGAAAFAEKRAPRWTGQ